MNTCFFLKFIKFGIVGFIGMILDFSTTWLLKEKIKTNRYVANSGGSIMAASLNYVINRVWTFGNHSNQIISQYLTFMSTSIIGLLINNSFLYLFEKKFSLRFYFAKLFAIGVTTIWIFLQTILLPFHK